MSKTQKEKLTMATAFKAFAVAVFWFFISSLAFANIPVYISRRMVTGVTPA